MNRTRILGLSAAIAFLAASPLHAQTNPPKQTTGSAPTSQPSRADQHFLTEAIQGDLAEVQVGKLAQQKGESADVKQFGQMLEQDHGQHLQQAQQVASQVGVTAPTEPSASQKATYDKLSKLSGASFDKQFTMAMLKDHKEDIAKFQKMAKEKSPVGDLAGKTVPVLQKHLQSAEALTPAKSAKH